MPEIVPLEWTGSSVRLLDQTKLPQEQAVIVARTHNDLVHAIKAMQIRGAPAIGIAGAYALVLAAKAVDVLDVPKLLKYLTDVGNEVAGARPTAVNLGWAVERMLKAASTCRSVAEVHQRLEVEAVAIHREDVTANRQMGALGSELLSNGRAVLTHCNTGALATGGFGTALGVIRSAWEKGKRFQVIVTETRPFLQGARLTAWELVQMGIPATLIVDSAAGSLLSRGEVTCVIVGADRIAANGDVANKIGTYTLAVLAHENGIPFYVAAPTSTLDLSLPSGIHIPIEERAAEEVTAWGGRPTSPKGIKVRNPAFDVTPHRFVTAIITERGVARAPYEAALQQLMGEKPLAEPSPVAVPRVEGAPGG